jgi:PHD/YefM family antitoxin component YafN of YafNO toxin-antitoxin module
MRHSSQAEPISDLKAAADVLTRIAEQREPMIITRNGVAEAASHDVASFEETQETLALLKILTLGSQDVAAGKLKPVLDVVDRHRGVVDGEIRVAGSPAIRCMRSYSSGLSAPTRRFRR